MKKDPVFKELDLNDGTFISLSTKNEILSVNIELWNNKLIIMIFCNVLRFSFNSPDFLSELKVISPLSEFMKDALSHRYAQIPTEPSTDFPKNHPYHHYQLLDINKNSVLEVIAETATYKEVLSFLE